MNAATSAAIKTFTKAATSPAPEDRREAILWLAMVLEKNTRASNEAGYYASVLPPELAELSLDDSQQKELLERLVVLEQLREFRSSLIWAMGKANPEAGRSSLVGLLRQDGDSLGDEDTYQAVIALDTLCDVGAKNGKKATAALPGAFKDSHLIDFLRRAAASDVPRVAEHAQPLLRRLLKMKRG